MAKGSHSTMGIYAGRTCPGCGTKVIGSHLGGQWLHTPIENGQGEPQTWHFACKVEALRKEVAATEPEPG